MSRLYSTTPPDPTEAERRVLEYVEEVLAKLAPEIAARVRAEILFVIVDPTRTGVMRRLPATVRVVVALNVFECSEAYAKHTVSHEIFHHLINEVADSEDEAEYLAEAFAESLGFPHPLAADGNEARE